MTPSAPRSTHYSLAGGVGRVTLSGDGSGVSEAARLGRLLDQPAVKAVIVEGIETLLDVDAALAICSALERSPVFGVAAVRGRCGLAGAHVLQACHLRIASTRATFERAAGVSAEVSAFEALAAGLVNGVVPAK